MYERYRCCKRDKAERETIYLWLIELRAQTAMCEFSSQEEDMLRDKTVFGIADQRAKNRMLREGDFTLRKALHIAHAAEST